MRERRKSTQNNVFILNGAGEREKKEDTPIGRERREREAEDCEIIKRQTKAPQTKFSETRRRRRKEKTKINKHRKVQSMCVCEVTSRKKERKRGGEKETHLDRSLLIL
uniref:Uncharacterized protein n=1 Tax=Cacopsylla melanoneura TaxID=428564 RepID=A0A8D8Z9V9_9HEMI